MAAPAPAERRGPAHTLVYLSAVGQRVKGGAFQVDEGALETHEEWSPAEVVEELDPASLLFATDNKTHMLGVQAEDVLTSALVALTAARESGEVVPFLKDCILALNLGPTIARSHVQQYRALSEGSLFRQYEIRDRTLDPGAGQKGAWVTGSSMNATAVRWLGLILFTMVNPDSFLGAVAKKTGTILSPPPPPPAPAPGVAPVVTRASLLIEASKEVTPQLRQALLRASPVFKKTIAALDAIYGDAGPGLGAALQVAEGMADYEI